jgi:hypothetical protein
VLWLLLPALVASVATTAWMMTGSRARRVIVLAVASLWLATPFALRDASIALRTTLAFAALWSWLRLIDLAFDRQAISAGRRVLHAVGTVELRRSARTRPFFDARAFAHLAVFVPLSALAVHLVLTHSEPVLRWAAGVVVAYSGFEVVASALALHAGSLGFVVPRLHDDPIKARSVAEFWGERWNRIVGRWLAEHCFRPLARRRAPVLGVVAAFGVSTTLHVYLAWAALDARAALSWAGFFLLQIPIVLVERRLRVVTWPPLIARAWTLGVFLLASPLFVGPVLRVIDALWSSG